MAIDPQLGDDGFEHGVDRNPDTDGVSIMMVGLMPITRPLRIHRAGRRCCRD